MSPSDYIGAVGAALAALGGLYYLYDIVWGETRPHPVTWIVWSCIGLLGFGVSAESGAGPGSYVAGVYAIEALVTAALSIAPRYGKLGLRRSDLPLGAIAIVGVAVWRFGALAGPIAATIAVACDAVAVWPTLREAWHQPRSESIITWSADVAATCLSVLALESSKFSALAYPIYLLLANCSVLAVLLLGRGRQRHAYRGESRVHLSQHHGRALLRQVADRIWL